MSPDLDEARALLEAAGFVVLREKSYRQAQERQRVAEALRAAAYEDREAASAWARDCLAEERHLRDRLTYVYGVACAHGASHDELVGSRVEVVDLETDIANLKAQLGAGR